MTRRAGIRLMSAVALGFALIPTSAMAQADPCTRAVIVTLPGVTWEDVRRLQPPALMEAIEDGAVGSVSVRTNSSRTSLASGFATLGAGSRVDGGRGSGGPSFEEEGSGAEIVARDVPVAGLEDMRALLDESGYRTVRPGALSEALGDTPFVAIGNGDPGLEPPLPVGYGRWTLLAAMDESGVARAAATAPELLESDGTAPFGVRTDPAALQEAVDAAFELGCASMIVDQGDLSRVDLFDTIQGARSEAAFERAVASADASLASIRERLDEDDLLVVVAPTSPGWDPDVHFGIAAVVGPGFEPGDFLESSTTGREGIVALTDVAPTVLEHQGIEPPSSMIGRPMFGVAANADERVEQAIDLDAESVFIDVMRVSVSTAFVVLQVIVFAWTIFVLARFDRRGHTPRRTLRWLELAGLAIVAFPVTTYLTGLVDQEALGAVGFVALLLAVDAALVAATTLLVGPPLDRLLALTSFTLLLLFVDLAVGAPLQLNTVFSYSPIVAGRFSGVGNIAYSVLAATSLITATLIVHLARGSRLSLAAAGVVFLATIVFDGAPMLGSDVGGVIALVPGFFITWALLSGKRPSLRVVVIGTVAMLMALGLFLALDLAQPAESRTHLGRLFEGVREDGFDVFVDTIDRKVTTNLRVFTSTIWTYLVPPALALMAWLLFRPMGRWRRLAVAYPTLRAGLVGGIILSLLGFAVNDSGIVVPAMMLSFLAPMALLIHLTLEPEG